MTAKAAIACVEQHVLFILSIIIDFYC